MSDPGRIWHGQDSEKLFSIKLDLEEYFDSFDLWHKATVPQPRGAWEPTRALRTKFFSSTFQICLTHLPSYIHIQTTMHARPKQNHPSNKNIKENLNKSRHKADPVRHGASFPPNILVVVQLKHSGMMEVLLMVMMMVMVVMMVVEEGENLCDEGN